MSGELENDLVLLDNQSTNPSDVLKFTQEFRYKIINKLTNNGTKLPDDIKDVSGLLRDMDQSAQTTRKLDIEEKNGTDGAAALEMFRKLESHFGGRCPFEANEVSDVPRDPTVGVNIQEVAINPGEDHQGSQSLNVDNYVRNQDD